MNQQHSTREQANEDSTANEVVTLVDLLTALAKRKKLVLGMPIVFAVCATLFGLAMPNIYKATTTVLPTQQIHRGAATVLNQLGGFAGTTLGTLDIVLPPELFVSMLKSSTVADNLIQRFDLKKAYGTESPEKTRDLLAKNSSITAGRDRLIAVSVEDKDPKRAAEIANAYVEELLTLTNRMALTEASHRRLFYERALRSTKDKLAEARFKFKNAGELKGKTSGDSQKRALAETAATLRAQISAREIQLGAMQSFVTVNNQEYIQGHQEIGAMRAELSKLEHNNRTAQGFSAQSALPSDQNDLGSLHDVKYYEKLHALLENQYEAARLDEAKDSSIIEVLDKAPQPEHHIQPKRAFIVIAAALFGLFLAIFWVSLFDLIGMGQRPGEREKLEELKNHLRFK